MALISQLKKLARESNHSKNLRYGEGSENSFIFPYDDEFFKRYGDFLDEIGRIERMGPTDPEIHDSVIGILTPVMMVDIMLHEDLSDMTITEYLTDAIYDETSQEIAEKVFEQLFKFYRETPAPLGYKMIFELVSRNDRLFTLTDFEGKRESDSMIYTVTEYQ